MTDCSPCRQKKSISINQSRQAGRQACSWRDYNIHSFTHTRTTRRSSSFNYLDAGVLMNGRIIVQTAAATMILPSFLWRVVSRAAAAIHARFTGTTTAFCHHSIDTAAAVSGLCQTDRQRERERRETGEMEERRSRRESITWTVNRSGELK
jgi:hypothetical protein